MIKPMTNPEAWDYAIGMTKTDGLKPSNELMVLIAKEKQEEISKDDILVELNKLYRMK